MLMTLSLAKSLGPKGLTAVSLHPGVVGGTNLGTHIKWETEYMDLGESAVVSVTLIILIASDSATSNQWLTIDSTVAIDKQNGNKEGWSSGFDFKSPERGAATHVWASFAPELKGRSAQSTQSQLY